MPIADLRARREYHRRWSAARRAAAMAGASCVRCGSAARLELDHIDPSTKIDHKIWSWSKPRRLAELAKCQWLCHDCHRAKTTLENQEGNRAPRPRRGTSNYFAKLTEDSVQLIRNSSDRSVDLAVRFGVDRSTISRIRSGSSWK